MGTIRQSTADLTSKLGVAQQLGACVHKSLVVDNDDYDHYGTELWIPKAIAETYLPAELFEEWLERSIEQRDDEDDELFDTNIRVEFDKYSPADPNDSDGYLCRDDLLTFNGIDPSIQQET